MKPAILFVDDEANILQGLRRMLRGMRSEWDMDFAEGGEIALSKLSGKTFDVVVTDMKMPGMNGAELLDQVSALYPRSIRLILSGEADTEATFRTIKTSHQFLPKPSNSERLAEIIKATLQRRDSLGDEKLQTLVTAVGCLPVSQAAGEALNDLIEQESASIDQAADIFALDPALTAKVIQLANSAYFGIGDPVVSPKAAVNLLGWDVLRVLLLKHALGTAYPAGANKAIYESTMAQAQDVSELAGWIASQEGADQADVNRAQLTGLLQGLGRLVLCAAGAEDYAKVPALVTAGKTIGEAEYEIFGEHHWTLGAYLAQLWALPQPVVDAIRFLHQPSALEESAQGSVALLAGHAALGIATGMRSSDPKAVAASLIDPDFLSSQSCDSKLDNWLDGWANRETAA